MINDETFDKVLASIDRNDDGSVDEKKLLDALAEEVTIDLAAVRQREARQALDRRRRDGGTRAEGTLLLPFEDPSPWEPKKLVLSEDGAVIELEKAPPAYLFDSARRKRKNANAATHKANRAQTQAEEFGKWALTQDPTLHKFGVFIKTVNAWSPDEAEQDEDDEDVA